MQVSKNKSYFVMRQGKAGIVVIAVRYEEAFCIKFWSVHLIIAKQLWVLFIKKNRGKVN